MGFFKVNQHSFNGLKLRGKRSSILKDYKSNLAETIMIIIWVIMVGTFIFAVIKFPSFTPMLVFIIAVIIGQIFNFVYKRIKK